MRMIHCSDLHLDSRMESNLSAKQAKERKTEILNTFVRMTTWAAAQEVEAVLLAGDLFDTGRVTGRTADLVLDTIRNAAPVQFFYLKGNHDENADILAGRNLPENLHTFDGGWTYYQMDGVTIAGLELNGDNWETMYDGLKLSAEDINIVMLHGQESTQPGEELIVLPRLRGKHIDYLALGHIHSYREMPLDHRGKACYSGCLEGRGFDECGEKGFVLLEVEQGQVNASFVPFALRRLYQVPVDITDLLTVTQLRGALASAARGIDGSSLVRFILTGTYTPETQKDLAYLTREMESHFWLAKVKDESRFYIDPASYQHDISLKGAFVRLVMASQRSEEEKAEIICAGLQALAGEEITL